MNVNDLALGFDPTNQTTITGAQLASLITTATPSSDRGFVLFTSDDPYGTPNVPNPNTTPEFARYPWIRMQANVNAFSVYIWNPAQLNPNNPSQLLNWNPIALGIIPAGSITNLQLAGGITYDKINSVSISSIINNSTLVLTTTTLSGGNITGSFMNGLTLANGSVTNAMLVADTTSGSPNAAVNTNNIVNQAITLPKLYTDATAIPGRFLTAQGAGNAPTWTALGTIKLLQTVYQDCTTAGYIAAGSSGANTQISYANAPGLKFTAANPGVLTNVGSSTGLPVGFSTSGKPLSTPLGICTSITPLSLSSYMLIDVVLNIFTSQADLITMCLYGFGNAGAGALPSAALTSANSGIAVINNNGGSGSTEYSPLITASASNTSQAIQLFDCVVGFNRIASRFLIPTSSVANASLSYPHVIIPFIGAEQSNTALGINSSSDVAASAYYGGTVFASSMTIQEVLFP